MENLVSIWNKAENSLKKRLGQNTFETWIMPLKPKAGDKDSLVLEAPDDFFRDWVEKHYKLIFQEEIHSLAKKELKVILETAKGSAGPAKGPFLRTRTQENPTLNPRYTFENFVVGPSNRHAHAYSLAAAESPAKT